MNIITMAIMAKLSGTTGSGMQETNIHRIGALLETFRDVRRTLLSLLSLFLVCFSTAIPKGEVGMAVLNSNTIYAPIKV